MTRLIKDLMGKLALLGGALVGIFLVLEFVVFKYVLVPSDVLPNVTINGVVRYMPSSDVTFRHPDGSQTRVTINAEGWNSTWREYKLPRTQGTLRVAVVGDSYVHGAFINTGEGFPEVIQRELNADGIKSEVYRFGMDGAPLSQYLWMLKKEVVQYKPDIVVVQLIHNDFDETTRFMGTRYNSSFLKIGKDAAGNPTEIAPKDFEPGWPDVLRELRTFRYLYYSTNASQRLKSIVTKYIWGTEEQYAPEFISSAVDIRNLSNLEEIAWSTRYVMGEIKALADKEGFAVMFAMDGVREAIYDGKPLASYRVAALNEIAARTARELDLPFLDLQQTFATDYAARGERLEYSFDWHWNKHANEIVGAAITNALKADARTARRLSPAPSTVGALTPSVIQNDYVPQ